MTVEERLSRLEQQNRKLKITLACITAVGLVALIAAAKPTSVVHESLKAKEIYLVSDDEGKFILASLKLEKSRDVPTLRFYPNRETDPIVSIGEQSDGSRGMDIMEKNALTRYESTGVEFTAYNKIVGTFGWQRAPGAKPSLVANLQLGESNGPGIQMSDAPSIMFRKTKGVMGTELIPKP